MSTEGVVRVGNTVRRPVKSDADYVHALLRHFEQHGFEGAPRFLGLDEQRRAILSYVDGFAPPHNGFRLSEQALRAGGRLLRTVHDLTTSTEFAAGAEVACHPGLSQPNFVFRDMSPVAIIDWDGTRPGLRRDNLGDFLWAFVHPAVYGDGEPAARMLEAALDGYGWAGAGSSGRCWPPFAALRTATTRATGARTSSPTWSGMPTSSSSDSAPDDPHF